MKSKDKNETIYKVMAEYVKEAKEVSNDKKLIRCYNKELENDELRQMAVYNVEQRTIEDTKLKIAKNMLRDNISINMISKYTKLSKAEIEYLE